MNITRFVSVAAIILAGWLGATFFNDVPAMRYPKLDRTPATASLDEDLKPDLTPSQSLTHEISSSVSR